MPRAKVGEKAPDFDMPSTKNLKTLDENVRLADYSGRWAVLLMVRVNHGEFERIAEPKKSGATPSNSRIRR